MKRFTCFSTGFTSISLAGILALAGAGNTFAANFGTGNLVVAVAQGTGNNTTVNLQEFTPAGSTSGLNNVALSGTGTNAFRISASAGTTCYISMSADQTLVTVPGANSTNTSSNENTLNPRFIATVNSAATANFTGTYTGISGEQERSATTLDNVNYFISDQGGFYTNGATTPSNSTNILSIRSFGGQVYVCSAKTSPNSPVELVASPTASTFTSLPGVAADASAVDFSMISSGNNGTAYDILYVLSSGSGLVKYSLVGGTWVSNGADTNAKIEAGFGMAAASNGSGGVNFYMVTPAATASNTVIKVTDQAGYNTTINDTTPATLLTSTSSTAFKSVAFAPVPVTISTTGTLTALSTNQGTASASTSFSVSAVSLTNNITVTAPAGFEISTSSGSGYASSLTLTQSGGSVPSTTIFVRLAAATSAGTYSGPVTLASTGVPTSYVPTAASTVASSGSATISTTGTPSALSTTFGTASSPTSFSASGSSLSGNITVTAPTGFEISTSSGSGYSGTLALVPSSGSVPSTTIFVRLAALDAAGTYSGNVSLAAAGATTVNVAIPSSTVSGSANLSSLSLSTGGFTKAFSSTLTSYTQFVNASVTSTTVNATADPSATVTVNGQPITSAVSLSTGTNTLAVLVTNGGLNQTYTVTVVRAGAFTPGNLVVTVYGNIQTGSTFHPDGLATKITLAEFSPTIAANSTPFMAFALPSVAAGKNVGLTGEYGSSSEGTIQQTADGLYLTIGGYDAAQAFAFTGTGTTQPSTALAQSPCATVSRVAALVDGNTNADTSSVFNDIYNTNNPRCVYSADDFHLYLSGQGAGASDEGGVYLTQEGTNVPNGGTAPTGIFNAVSTRNIVSYNGNLYYSADQNSGSKGTQTGIFEYSGLPTVSQGTFTGTRLTPASSGSINYSPQAFWFANATTLYIGDTGDPKAGGTGDGGIQKWVYNGSAWTLAYTLTSSNFVAPSQATSASHGETGLQSLAGTVSNGVAYLYGTSYTAGDADPNGLYGVTDTLTAVSSTATLTEIAAAPGLQSSGTNTDYLYKGVSFAPVGLPANTSVATSITTSGATLNGSINPQGTDTVVYFQYGTSSTALTSTTTQQDLGSGTSAVPFNAGLSGLQPGTTYYYQLVTVSSGLTSTYAVQSFTTAGSAETPTDTPTMPAAGLVVLALALMGFAYQTTRRRVA